MLAGSPMVKHNEFYLYLFFVEGFSSIWLFVRGACDRLVTATTCDLNYNVVPCGERNRFVCPASPHRFAHFDHDFVCG